MKAITAYQCGFCPRIQMHLRNAKKHEAGCALNPANRSCLTCKHHGTALDSVGDYAPYVFWTCASENEEAADPPSYEVRNCPAWEQKARQAA